MIWGSDRSEGLGAGAFLMVPLRQRHTIFPFRVNTLERNPFPSRFPWNSVKMGPLSAQEPWKWVPFFPPKRVPFFPFSHPKGSHFSLRLTFLPYSRTIERRPRVFLLRTAAPSPRSPCGRGDPSTRSRERRVNRTKNNPPKRSKISAKTLVYALAGAEKSVPVYQFSRGKTFYERPKHNPFA